MDYGVQFNKLMYERLIQGGDITLFSPHDVPEMYEAFFNNQERFKELYERAERNTKLRKKTLKAADVFTRYITERKDTGRIYLQNVDHANTHSPFKEEIAPIKMSNLCLTGDTLVDVIVDGINKNIRLDEIILLFNQGKDIKVESKDLATGSVEYKQITFGAMTARKSELILIEDEESGKSIKCTPDHKVYTKNRGYIMAKDLREDDEIDIR
jgi:ribonucleotide reductase alpha subunit